ncbi:FAD-binding oxidoreductase [Pseudovibrio sp. SPO723]|uniref:NAD(P)/FAD-dependent oxidoreductase n=1 Tax=Nesiotobacter zosterae TaxID=392721 RepID=UPI0029C3A8ED|nr:FAD-binding oxidoreductase [Pseudovibrio sp. SPO723]MDX5594135.1 FAD-binding oxidoreductase [Pseudovibrio sp. SPO723]
MHSEHIGSFYSAQLGDRRIHPELVGGFHSQIGIVGGGFAGLTAGIELLKRGRSVVLLEAERIGWGASGRNGGFVSAGFAEGMDAIEAAVGLEDAKKLYKLSQEGVSYVRRTLEGEGAATLIEGHGWLKVQRHKGADALKRRQEKMATHYGVDLDFWETDQLKSKLKTDRYFHGLHNPEPFHMDPLAYAEILLEKFLRLGGIVHEETRVLSLKRNGASWRINTAHGCVSCEHVVLATSAYGVLNQTYYPVDRTMQPVATYVIASEVLGERLRGAVDFGGCVADTRRAGDYYRTVEGGERLLWGGRITTRRSEPKRLAELLKAQILQIYPQLGDFRVDFAWSGLMGYSRTKMPLIGELKPGLWAVTAFGGHGLSTTAMGGEVVAKGIAEGDDTWRLFNAFGPVWAGGSIGRLAVQAEYIRLQALDRFEEARSGRAG